MDKLEKFLNIDSEFTLPFMQIIYWFLLLAAVWVGLQGFAYFGFLTALIRLVAGILLVRIVCEALYAIFQIRSEVKALSEKD